MVNFKKLSKEEMKMVLGGDDRIVAGAETCNCNTKDDCTEAGKGLCYNCGSNGSGNQKYGYCAA